MADFSNKCTFVLFLCLSICLLGLRAELSSSDEEPKGNTVGNHVENTRSSSAASSTALFEKLFKLKRSEHKGAIQRIVAIQSNEKQHKLLEMIISKIMEVLSQSRVKLEGSGYLPGSGFPQDEAQLDSLSSMIENTAFMGDLVLYLPDTAKEFLKNNEWSNVFKWSLSLCQESTFLDNITKKMLHLVAQELNLVEREPNFYNPYAKSNQKKPHINNPEPTEKKKRKKISKGPSLSGNRHKNEL